MACEHAKLPQPELATTADSSGTVRVPGSRSVMGGNASVVLSDEGRARFGLKSLRRHAGDY